MSELADPQSMSLGAALRLESGWGMAQPSPSPRLSSSFSAPGSPDPAVSVGDDPLPGLLATAQAKLQTYEAAKNDANASAASAAQAQASLTAAQADSAAKQATQASAWSDFLRSFDAAKNAVEPPPPPAPAS